MSDSYSLPSLTELERDLLAYYHLGPDPDQHPLRPVTSIPAPSEPPADDSADDPIQMLEAA